MRKRNDKQATTSNNIIGWVVVGVFVVAVGLLVSWVLSSDNDNTNSGGEDTSPPTTQLEDDTNTDQPVTDDEAVEPEPPAAPTPDAVGAETAAITAAYDFLDDGTPSEREEIARWWAAPDFEDELVEQLHAGDQTEAEMAADGAGQIRTEGAVLAVKVEHVDDNTAQVLVWSVSVFSAVDLIPPQAIWLTTQYDMVWLEDRWQIEAQETRRGPVPGQQVEAETIFDGAEFQEALEGFVPLHGRIGTNSDEAGD